MRRAAGAAVLAVVFALAPLGAQAAEPDDLEAGHITDRSGVLTAAEESRLEERLAALADEDDRPELYVVFVEDFEDPSGAAAWADETAEQNNLGADQYLLAIATEGRALAISYDDAGPLSESRVLEIEEGLQSGYLADDDWVGGVEYVAAEFDEVPPPWWVWLLGLAALALLIFVIIQFVLLGRRKAARALELRTLDGQKKRASITLVRTDEALRTSEQELGFVTAEFGDEATAEFQAVLSDGRAKLDRAFELQTRLQDATEDTAADTRSWTDEILALCGQVNRALDERTKKLAELRGLAKDAAATVARLTKARAEADALVAGAESRLATLRRALPAERLAAIADDPHEMREHLAHADSWLLRLREAAQGGKVTAITTAVHEIERDLAEVAQLHAAVAAAGETAAIPERSGDPAPRRVGAPALGVDPEVRDVALSPGTTSPTTGDSESDRAAAAVRGADAAVAARPGQIAVQDLAKLRSAQKELALAYQSVGDPEAEAAHARAAIALASQVQQAAAGARAVPSAPRRRPLREYATDPDAEDRGPKAIMGAFGGGAVGLFSGLGVLGQGDDGGGGGLVLLFVLGGIVLGALSGTFGGDSDGGSSSGWGGSSSGSRSSRSSSSRSSWGGGSSRSSGGGRSFSSGRSSAGGRRF